ncbi:hypothetical protein D3C76_1410700 [compost metagenome]
MITCAIPSRVLRCEPSRKPAKSLAITLADASDSQAWASRVSVSMSGAMTNIVLGL